MCGIAGCLSLAGQAGPDERWVQTATERITHRGPDDEGFYVDPDVALGYKRLAIIDLSPGGHQPMRSADGRYWMVYNGEIYNYVELGEELRRQGVALRTSSDSEVLLETYARVGKDVVHHLRGMYAFAIWDTWTRELFCARDPFGIKPFYYRLDEGESAPPGPGLTGRPGAAGAPGQQPQPGFASGPAGTGPGVGFDGERPSAPGGRHAAPTPGQAGPSADWLGADPATPSGGRHAARAGEQGPAGHLADPAYPTAASGPQAAAAAAGSLWDTADRRSGTVWGQPSAPWDQPAPARGRAPWEQDATSGTPWDAPGTGVPPAGAAQRPGGLPGDGQWDPAARPPSGASWEQAGPDWGGAQPGEAPWGQPGPGGRLADAATGQPTARTGLRLRFCSERKSLAEPGELRDLDADSLRRYLAFQYVPPPQTLTPPIKVLPPGHAMIARPGGEVDVYRYWRAELRPARAAEDTTARAILAALRDSIAVHLRSDAPLGAFLSGGIDSAAICALAAEHRPDLLTFTVGFEREGYSEIDRAQETAAAIGVKSLPYVISPQEFFHYLPQIIWHLDDPMADAAAIPLWFVAREAAKHVKVVLSGEGSDELFGGYAIYHQPGVVRAGERLPDWGRAPLKAAASLIPAGVKGKGLLERTSTPLRRRYIGNAHVFTGELIDQIARPGRGGPYDVTDPVYDQAEDFGLDDVSTMQLVDINTWLAGDILVKADRMTMAHSLELRVPFLDREVMKVAARLAREEKIGAGTTKLALRAAMSEVLPRAAAERAKLGFPVPIGHWLKGEAYGFAQHLLREAQTEQWIDRDAALSLLERFRAGEPDVTWRHLWVLIVFSLWHQIYVERVYDPVALGWEAPQGVSR